MQLKINVLKVTDVTYSEVCITIYQGLEKCKDLSRSRLRLFRED